MKNRMNETHQVGKNIGLLQTAVCTTLSKRALLVLMLCLLAIPQVWGATYDYYYFFVELKIEKASGCKGNGTFSSGSTKQADGEYDDLDAAKFVTFILDATADGNSVFRGWSSTSNEYNEIFSSNVTEGSFEAKRAGATYTEHGRTKPDGFGNYNYREWNGVGVLTRNSHKSYTITQSIYAWFEEKQSNFDVTFASAKGGGSYTYKNGEGTATIPDGQPVTLDGSTSTTLTATANTNCKLFAWYVSYDGGTTYNILSKNAEHTVTFDKPAIVYAQFIPTDAALFMIKEGDGTEYWNLNEACTVAQSSSTKIVLPKENGTLYSLGTLTGDENNNKDYTILGGVTLLIPYDEDYTTNGATVARVDSKDGSPTPSRTLTLAEGVRIVVNGNIEVGGEQNRDGQNTTTVGAPRRHGVLKMHQNSQIVLEDESNLYCWGYILAATQKAEGVEKSEGSVIAESGSQVYECIQIRDWKGGTCSSGMVGNEHEVFPVNQYYIQNVEVPITFKSGAKNLVSSAVLVSSVGLPCNAACLIGDGGMFTLKENSVLLRDYNEEGDRQVYTIDGDAQISALSITFESPIFLIPDITLNSSSYLMPLTNNMTLNIESGQTVVSIDVLACADTEINIKQRAKVNTTKDVYIYDSDDWGNYATFAQISPLFYAQGKKFPPYIRTSVSDAKICVDGELIVNGKIYTTAGGADICSTGTGKVTFKSAPTDPKEVWQVTNTTPTYESKVANPAWLHNDENKTWNKADAYKYTQTAGSAAGDEFWYVKSLGRWMKKGIGDPLDIVDADTTNKTLTINANGWASSGWPYMVDGVLYEKTDREADRTLIIPYNGTSGASLPIAVLDENYEVIISNHIYKVPYVYDGGGTYSGTDENSIVFVHSGTLTVSETDVKAAAIYVSPGAELNVTGTLTVGKLVLRTTPWQAAVLTNSGTITGQVYYSRITRDQGFHLFAIPAGSNTASVVLSDGSSCAVTSTTTPYGAAWQLREYNTARRAAEGATGANWDNIGVNADKTTYSDVAIEASKGYELRSGSKYYREYCFPITLPTTATSVDITAATGAAGSAHAGWNILCSPYVSTYTVTATDPATGIKVCWQQEDGTYIQSQPTSIPPATPFAYQASAAGTLNFAVSTAAAAPRRQSAAEAATETEWVHLDINNAEGRGDETSIFVHPTRFEQTYKIGIDVAKQSLTASRAILYSAHAYGYMAFAGVADTLLEKGIDLVVYSPAEQELTISLRENAFLNRLEYLWLIDNKTGARTDLLLNNYTFLAAAGTDKERFEIQGRFKAPQISTGLDNTSNGYTLYTIGNTITIGGVEPGTPVLMFDAVGHMLFHTTATTNEVSIPAVCAGVYMLHIGGQTHKMVIGQ